MPPDALIAQTFSRFPDLDRTNVVIDPLEKGGSDRKYYRIRFTQDYSVILVKYGSSRDENRHYCKIAEYLSQLGVRVPKIYFHDETEGLIWMEDLGERDLWSFRREPEHVRMELYRATLDEITRLHNATSPVPDVPELSLQVEFNTELYQWEQRYFFENCLQRYFEISPAKIEQRCDMDVLAEIAARLDGLPRTLVHRDFQSQNVILLNGQPCLIDFQGLRSGLPHYDLASLIYDPYVLLTGGQQEELVQYARAVQTHSAGNSEEEFREILDLCAVQRLMQALGAYGYLGLVRERAVFLGYIPTAMASLRTVLERVPGLTGLHGLVSELC